MVNLLSTHNGKAESFYHKAIKRLFFKYISENNSDITEKSLEKYINNRRADVFFKLKSGKQIVIEVQNSKITVKEIINRTEYYNNVGIYVLWILYGNGACVASPKLPEDKKNSKISTVENFLHRMFAGRVYYVNMNLYDEKVTISTPFALYFSPSSSKKNQKLFHTKYENYYIKNVNFARIPNWNLLCVNYNSFKIARFFDKNVKRELKDQISLYNKNKLNYSISKNKLFKLTIKHFKYKYGIPLIYKALLELIQEKKLIFNHRIVNKIQNKVNR